MSIAQITELQSERDELLQKIDFANSEMVQLKDRIAAQDKSLTAITNDRDRFQSEWKRAEAKIECQKVVEKKRQIAEKVDTLGLESVREEITFLKSQLLEAKQNETILSDQSSKTIRDSKEQNRKANIEIERLSRMLNEMNTVLGILFCSGGALLGMLGIFGLIYHYKMRSIMAKETDRARRDERVMILKAKEPLPFMPSHANRLGVNEHPMVRDVFGMKEVFDVTAGEGKDLVRIARPLVTAGAERKLSEELMDIQPIIAGREGARRTQITSTGKDEGTLHVTEKIGTSGV